jgi:Ferredoxin-like domain in Api92-like protein
MLNRCFANFTVTGPADEMLRFREAIRGSEEEGDETPFDFNRLIPMPCELGETTADFGQAYCVYYGDAERILAYPWIKNLGIDTIEKLREHFDADPEHRATADQQKINIEKYGAPSWFEWRIQHWGTKSNACDAAITENGDGSLHVNFETAWTFPFPIFQKLAADFPMPNFEASAKEPDMGIFIKFDGHDGEISWEGDEEAREAAAPF